VNTEESRLAVLFESVAANIDLGRFESAARLADSARRFAPSNLTAILLHARLLLRGGHARAAAELVRGREDSDSLLLLAEAACSAGSTDEASDYCRLLLSGFPVDALNGLPAIATRLCRADLDRFPGWVGISSNLRLTGELSGGCVASIEHDGMRLGTIAAGGARPETSAFSFEPPRGLAGLMRVRVRGVDLLGSGARWPPDFGVRGWVLWKDRRLSGEILLNWAPRSAVQIIASHGTGDHRFMVAPITRGVVGWSFSVPFDPVTSPGAEAHVCAVLPDGSTAPLAGSPVRLLRRTGQSGGKLCRRKKSTEHDRAATPPRRINVVVPVHSGVGETLNCLQSVLATIDSHMATITVVDDASPEPELRRELDELAAAGRITVLRNSVNLGFPGAANRGMELHPTRDVVLLNSDTEVFGDWLERLRAAASVADDIGTATPFGETASITSYSARNGHPYSSAEAAEIDRIARAVNGGQAIEIPVGVGFCLYVRRSCLDEVGAFDELTFGKGYGEENDFCLRASRRGWRHVAATGLFVRHVGGRSYGPSKHLLSARNSHVINYRYPGYDQLIADFIADDPLRNARRAIDRRRLLDSAKEPVLLVSFDLPGGVKRHVEERQAFHQEAGRTVLVLRSAEASKQQETVRIDVAGTDLEHLVYALPRELAELRTLMLELRLRQIEMHHFLGLSDAVLDMVVALGVAFRVYVHDYAWICPRVSLLNGDGVYCGEPPIQACESCVKTHGSAFSEPTTVTALRARSARILGGAEQVVVPTRDVRARFGRHFPGLAVAVTPWEAPHSTRRRARRARGSRTRVALIGAIGTPKGYSLLLACARDAAARHLPLEFVVVGYTRDDTALLETGRVFVTGPYDEREVPGLLEREGCDIALFPSLAPETWCYALTHALAESLSIVAIDLGAVAERLRAAGVGVLLPLNSTATTVNDSLLQQSVKPALHTIPLTRSTERPMEPNTSSGSEQAAPDLAASVQVIALPVGIYAFTVSRGGNGASPGLCLPALQIAGAPIRSDATIEFLEGPSTVGRWLTRTGDVVMVKIAGNTATLLLTSLRAPDSSVLSVDIRRLDVPESPEAAQSGRGEAADGLPASSSAPEVSEDAEVSVGPEVSLDTEVSMDPEVSLDPEVSMDPEMSLDPEVSMDPEVSLDPEVSMDPEVSEDAEVSAQTLVHVQNVGDLQCMEGWAGRAADNLWIEAFSVVAQEPPIADLLEYTGEQFDGAANGWLSGGALCGTRGAGAPLAGFAVRVKEGADDVYSCAYTGRFLSGVTVGPFNDGSLCRSDSADDPLVAIELKFEKRPPVEARI
jgi:GT2 family glycosyltransferase